MNLNITEQNHKAIGLFSVYLKAKLTMLNLNTYFYLTQLLSVSTWVSWMRKHLLVGEWTTSISRKRIKLSSISLYIWDFNSIKLSLCFMNKTLQLAIGINDSLLDSGFLFQYLSSDKVFSIVPRQIILMNKHIRQSIKIYSV
jgi:hypothetical protein